MSSGAIKQSGIDFLTKIELTTILSDKQGQPSELESGK